MYSLRFSHLSLFFWFGGLPSIFQSMVGAVDVILSNVIRNLFFLGVVRQNYKQLNLIFLVLVTCHYYDDWCYIIEFFWLWAVDGDADTGICVAFFNLCFFDQSWEMFGFLFKFPNGLCTIWFLIHRKRSSCEYGIWKYVDVHLIEK